MNRMNNHAKIYLGIKSYLSVLPLTLNVEARDTAKNMYNKIYEIASSYEPPQDGVFIDDVDEGFCNKVVFNDDSIAKVFTLTDATVILYKDELHISSPLSVYALWRKLLDIYSNKKMIPPSNDE